MSVGPIDVAVIAFPGNQFTGQIAPALREVVEQGAVRIIDLVFLTKDADGSFEALEIGDVTDVAGSELAALSDQIGGLLTQEDLTTAAAELEPNSSAALIVFEHTWAARLKQAIVDANGRLVANVRIPHEDVEQALRDSGIDA